MRRVVLFIGRASDGRYFNGTTFVAASTALPLDFDPATGRFSRRIGLPNSSQLTPGRYVLTVKAVDGAGRVGADVININVAGATNAAGVASASASASTRRLLAASAPSGGSTRFAFRETPVTAMLTGSAATH